MENASKALIMGAGMIIAVLIITLAVSVYRSISENYRTGDDVEIVEQITAFNKEYESYNRKLLRGTDIITLCNKAIDNNKKYNDVPERQITITFMMKESFVYSQTKDSSGREVIKPTQKTFKVGETYQMTEINSIKGDKEAFNDFKRRIFNCTKIQYHQANGTIESMYFEEQKIDYTEGL